MRTRIRLPYLPLLACTLLLLAASGAHARGRAYGVCGERGTFVSTPGGAAWSGEYSSGAVTRRGTAVVTENGAAAVDRRGVAVAGGNGVVVAGRYGAATVTTTGGATVVATRPILPAGYYATLPMDYRAVVYGGYHCYFGGGVYYRPVFYGGNTVYVIVP